MVFVDDGSTDGTFERLARLHASDPRMRVVRLRRNFGQTAAFSAGFAAARDASSPPPTATSRTTCARFRG